ncbi:hypothetical protein D3OALGB2SA_311 [Olavius algarvensis associated proteobacterium Delta 3]|nr:hypothetical protein D3OALGB2SA_311 [Olavius algarvensis associated proteobacterium Delta 3]
MISFKIGELSNIMRNGSSKEFRMNGGSQKVTNIRCIYKSLRYMQ